MLMNELDQAEIPMILNGFHRRSAFQWFPFKNKGVHALLDDVITYLPSPLDIQKFIKDLEKLPEPIRKSWALPLRWTSEDDWWDFWQPETIMEYIDTFTDALESTSVEGVIVVEHEFLKEAEQYKAEQE